MHALDVPPAAARAGVRIARIDFDWRVPLASPAYAALSDDERARAARFLRHEDGVRSAATRAALRDVLGAALGIAPRAVAIVVDAAGRPSLDPAHRASLDFNVSHAGAHALLAWVPAGRVGVDIEGCNRATDWRALTREVCAPAEIAYLDDLPSGEREGEFMRVWSAKEALLKALGTGIVGGLRAFAVVPPRDSATPATTIVDPIAPAAGVAAFDAAWLDAAPGYAACVAWTRA
ncbi:4'-phosphopantetheinyl transferase [Burkholderia sola]|nr:4'-phosphopantetheinyl transferase [Burkholderia cenocepacia]CAG2280872.1 4'-phosphopantetheinyl transferase [Burkholderia cenocepacia]CAG2281181.1 4'-phosphopantetheinyl transferase [Burkholderia cenocepacia]CAG2281411.1 4'-phosphopantetheinyl transferase [Burkholderia cenocepacia]CAG2281487.1 4'-phosphopantetheinyl transferase [Burkholderia cenocepacia]